jgi:hypothetical protein
MLISIPYHENSSKIKTYHTMRTAPKIKHTIPCFVFGAVLMVWYVLFLELFSWYGMFCFWSCSHGMVCCVFGAVIMVWYVLFLELFSWYDTSKNKTYHTMRTAPKIKHTIP